MIICGQEFEFSALNANDLDRMDAAQQHMQTASDRESKRAHTGTADILRGQCRLMMGYFDELLGEGASERLGLDGSNFWRLCPCDERHQGSHRRRTGHRKAGGCNAHEPGAAACSGKAAAPTETCVPQRGFPPAGGKSPGAAAYHPDQHFLAGHGSRDPPQDRPADRCPAGRRRSAGRS